MKVRGTIDRIAIDALLVRDCDQDRFEAEVQASLKRAFLDWTRSGVVFGRENAVLPRACPEHGSNRAQDGLAAALGEAVRQALVSALHDDRVQRQKDSVDQIGAWRPGAAGLQAARLPQAGATKP